MVIEALLMLVVPVPVESVVVMFTVPPKVVVPLDVSAIALSVLVFPTFPVKVMSPEPLLIVRFLGVAVPFLLTVLLKITLLLVVVSVVLTDSRTAPL